MSHGSPAEAAPAGSWAPPGLLRLPLSGPRSEGSFTGHGGSVTLPTRHHSCSRSERCQTGRNMKGEDTYFVVGNVALEETGSAAAIYANEAPGSRVVVAEWLRRWTRNPLGSPRAGSNPAGYDFAKIFLPSLLSVCTPKERRTSVQLTLPCQLPMSLGQTISFSNSKYHCV